MILENKKIRLRPLKREDIDTTFTWRHDPELRMLAQFHSYPITYELEKEWIEAILNDRTNRNVYFAIETIDQSKLIGYFQLKNIDWISKVAWLGVVIGEKSSRGLGFGKESLEMGLKYASNYLNLRKISLEVIVENKAAIHLYEKIGFIHEGTLKDHFFFSGQYHDIFLMSLTF